jgi:hypothetical protein
MFSRSSLLRTAAIATMSCTMAATPAIAREDIQPARTPAPATTVHVVAAPQHTLPPRVDGMGVKPVAPAARPDVPEVAAAIPVGLKSPTASHDGGGLDWLSATIGALALVAALLIAQAFRTSSGLRHRRATPPIA